MGRTPLTRGSYMWEKLLRNIAQKLITSGTLVIELPGGKRFTCGDGGGEPINIRLNSASAVRDLCLDPDLRFGESYMNGNLTIEGDDIRGLLALVVSNLSDTRDVFMRKFTGRLRTLGRRIAQHNPVAKARKNVEHHYDLSDELYKLFLDEDMQYSCAYFETPNDTLEQAQLNKKNHIATKLLLRPEHAVLDIGSGWGGMGLTLAKDYGCQVTGVTLSSNQHRISNLRAREADVSEKAIFTLMDYRAISAQFDRVVSVGMFEHVGVPHYREYFACLRRLLKSDGVALIHTIGRTSPPGATNPWITKYIFPGGYVPALSEVMTAVEKEGLRITDVEVLRLHYAETLRHWHERFNANVERVREMYDDRFCRMWKFYLAASEMTFRHNHQVVFQLQISKELESVPLTRDYIYRKSVRS